MRALFAAAMSLSLLILPANAEAAPQSGLEGLGAAVSDQQLGDLRGKFISPSSISYFGIQLHSSWQDAEGVTTEAALLFSVDFAQGAGNPDGATPRLLVSYDRDGDPSLDVPGVPAGYVAIAVPGGLGGVNGAVQSQQIAGDGNTVRNDMRIAVVPASAISNAGGQGMADATTGQTVQFADGDTLQFILAGNQVGLEMADGGQGVRQGFDGALGQAAQHVLLSSDNNSISNGMTIVIGFDALEQSGRANVQNALTAMKGMGF